GKCAPKWQLFAWSRERSKAEEYPGGDDLPREIKRGVYPSLIPDILSISQQGGAFHEAGEAV
ncbi:hypothetical protein, partial [Pseudoflavonifractor sp. AF19-9AC]|uniref:hypothetical protein n=1 Tax=Pseudoflavonifractor sp. AF19-9AC TaxID=2292244 RepID=UPI001A9BDA02